MNREADIITDHSQSLSSLQIACMKRDVNLVRQLVSSESDSANKKTPDGVTALHLACFLSDVELVKIILEESKQRNNFGVKVVNSQLRHSNLTPIMISTQRGDTDITRTLIEHGAEPLITISFIPYEPHYNNTSKPQLIRRDRGITFDGTHLWVDQEIELNGYNCYHLASYYGHHELLKLLIDAIRTNHSQFNSFQSFYNEMNSSPKMKQKNSNTMLSTSTSPHQHNNSQRTGNNDNDYDDKEMIKLILNTENCSGTTCLSIAIQQSHESIVPILIQNGVNVNQRRREDGASPLFLSCLYQQREIAELLLQNNAEVDATTWYTETTPLFIACQAGDISLVRTLINHMIVQRVDPLFEISRRNNEGTSPFHISCELGYANIVEYLLTILHRSQDLQPTLSSNITVSNVDHEKKINQSVESGATPFFIACQNNHLEVVKVLLSHGANPFLRRHDGFSPFYAAVAMGCTEIVAYLLQCLPPNDLLYDRSGQIGCTSFYLACQCGHLSSADVIYHADPSILHVPLENESGGLPIFVACKEGHVEIVRFLLHHGAELNRALSDTLVTPLMVACKRGHLEVVKLLLWECDRKVDELLLADRDRSAMYFACERGFLEIAQSLLSYHRSKTTVAARPEVQERVTSTPRSILNTLTKEGKSCLFIACALQYHDIVEWLLKEGADPNLEGQNPSPLFISCQQGDPQVVHLLLKYSAFVNYHRSSDGINCLQIATLVGSIQIVEILLNAGADVNYQSEDGQTALFIACEEEFPQIASLLLSRGANPNLSCCDGTTPLQIAEEQDAPETLLMELIRHGAINTLQSNS